MAAQPHPEIVAVRYQPAVSGRKGQLVVRAFNPSCGTAYAPTLPVSLRIHEAGNLVRAQPASRPIPRLARTQQVDLVFELDQPLPSIGRAGRVSGSPVPNLAGIRIEAETFAEGQSSGPRQRILQWPKAEPYAHEPMNVRGPFSQALGSAAAARARRAGELVEVDDKPLAGLVRAGRGPTLAGAADSMGEPPPATIVKGHLFASAGLGGVDTNLAVGRQSLIVTTSSRIGFYDKSGASLIARDGTDLGNLTIDDFFGPLDADLRANLLITSEMRAKGWDKCDYYDTRCMYDSYRRRFWVVCLANNRNTVKPYDVGARRNKIACAVSKTSDPRDGFWLYWWDGSPYDGQTGTDWKPGDRADYPSLGISPRFMMQTNQVNWLNPANHDEVQIRYAMITLVNADALAAGRPQAGWMFPRLKDSTGTQIHHVSMPAMHYGPSKNGRAYLTQIRTDKMSVYGFDSFFDFPKAPKLVSFPVRTAREIESVSQKSSADASPAPEIKLSIAPVPMRTVVRGDRLWTVMGEAVTWPGQNKDQAAVRYIRASLSSFDQGAIPTTAASGYIERTFGLRNKLDPANEVFGYGMPTVEVDRDGNAFIGYLRSGSSIFAESRFTLHYVNEPDVRPSLRLVAGQGTLVDGDGPYGQLDCLGASLDEDGKTVWLAIPFASCSSSTSTKAKYRIGISQIRL